MQLQHQSRLHPLGQARPGGECPFFARASLPPGLGTIVCVSYRMRRLCAVVVQSHLLPFWANSSAGWWRSMSEISVLATLDIEHPLGVRDIPANSRTSQVPSLQNPRKINFRGRSELFEHHAFALKTPTPPSGPRTQKVNLCALSSCLINTEYDSEGSTIQWK